MSEAGRHLERWAKARRGYIVADSRDNHPGPAFNPGHAINRHTKKTGTTGMSAKTAGEGTVLRDDDRLSNRRQGFVSCASNSHRLDIVL
jgi:hypothetical protein